MIVGHSRIVEDLRWLSDRGRLAHAYLFHGPSNVGKRLVALAFANYLERGEFAESGKILQDALLISPGENEPPPRRSGLGPREGGTIGIDEVRRIKGFLWQKPVASPRRTLIVDSAERMTEEAQNALLKIAEEPPPSSLLILVASDIESLRATITSRLAKVYFSTVPTKEISKWLEKESNVKRSEADSTGSPLAVRLGSPLAEKLAAASGGKPGLSWALKNDEKLQELLGSAQAFLKVLPTKRRDFIKKLVEPEEFNLREFIDALILCLAGRGKRDADLWHKLLELRGRVANFALNPRLQLEALLANDGQTV